jgi:hypothetical protein
MPNQRLASTMQYATFSAEFCHSTAESYFIRLQLCGMVTSLETWCIGACIGPQCNVAIASFSDRPSTSCSPTAWGQWCCPLQSTVSTMLITFGLQNCQGGQLDHAGRKLFHHVSNSSSFHANYCANRAITRLSSPFLQLLQPKLLFSNI